MCVGELFDLPVSVECSNSIRYFLRSWLKRFPWLAYSKYLDGAFCLPCVLFGVQCGRNSNKLDKLYKSPLTLYLLFLFFYFIIFNDTLVSSTETLPVNIFNLEGGETILGRDNENFSAPGENRTRDPPNTRSDVLTTEPPVRIFIQKEVLFMCLNGLGCSQNAGTLHSESTKFQIFLGEHTPKSP